MKLRMFHWLLLIIVISACQDSTDKFRADNSNSGYYISKSIDKVPSELWKLKTNGSIVSSVLCDKNNVYVGGDDSCFYAINKSTGIENWKIKTEGKIRSTAALDNEFVFFLSYDGFLYKVNRETGKVVWKFKTNGEKQHLIKDYYNNIDFVKDFWDFYQSSPLISNGIIYFGSGHNFYAVDAKSGNKVWTYEAEGSVHSSPAMKDNKIIFGSFDSRVYCLNALTGENFWTYETGRDTTYYVWLGVQASPAIEDDKVYIGSRDALIYCLNLNTGDTLWTNNNFERSWMPSSFAIGNDLYCGSSDGFSFYSIDMNNGTIKKKIKTNSYTFSSPAIDSSIAYIGSANGRLYGIDLNMGEIVWEYRTEGSKSDTLKIYNEKGELDVNRFKEILTTKQVDNYDKLVDFYNNSFKSVGSIVSSPVIDNGVLYFTSFDGYVYAISGE